MTTSSERVAESSVAPFILNRWSPGAFTPGDITTDELLDLPDAGRWAPSAYNAQPWRFLYARRDTPAWERFLSWLVPFNRSWAQNASEIVYIVSRTVTISASTGEPVSAPTRAIDAGAASVLIQLQATQKGWTTHPVNGFDKDLSHAGLELPKTMPFMPRSSSDAEEIPHGFRNIRKTMKDPLTASRLMPSLSKIASP